MILETYTRVFVDADALDRSVSEDLRQAMEEASAPSEAPARAEGKRDSEV